MKSLSLKSPDTYIINWYRKLSSPVKTAFYSAVILGLFAHLYQFTNKLYNYDELANTPGGIGLSTEQGRWLLNWMGRFMRSVFGGSYSLPFFNGIFALLFLALSAALVVSTLKIKNQLTAVLVGGLLVVFPAVVSMYFFMFLALYYAVGIFFSVLAAWLIARPCRTIKGAVFSNAAGVVLIACSLGTYQAYFPNTVCILLMVAILKAAFGGVTDKKQWKSFFLMVLRFLGMMAAGLILYFIINRVVLHVTGISLISYQGGDTMGKITPEQLVESIKRCYVSAFQLNFTDVMGLNYSRTVQRIIKAVYLLFGAGIGAYLFLKPREYVNKIIVVCGFAVFPIAMFLIYVMAPTSYCYTLMAYPVVFLFVFFMVWSEEVYRHIRQAELVGLVVSWISALSMAALVVIYIWYANGNYMALEYTKYHDFAYYQTMITQIKSVDGYNDDMPVIIVGEGVSDNTNSMGSLIGDTFIVGGKTDANVAYNSVLYILSDYLGFSPYYGTYEEIRSWMERDEVKEMPSYPDEGSIQVIDGTIIVKLSDYSLE